MSRRRSIALKVEGGRRVAELVQLEARRLARRLGVPIGAVRIRRVAQPAK